MNFSKYKELVDKLKETSNISYNDFESIFKETDADNLNYLYSTARSVCDSVYAKDIYIRGLIEFTNYCHNDCFYCGIRKSNSTISRYQLTEEEILECAQRGWSLGFRTFVLQGGEDDYFNDEKICSIVGKIKATFPESAITLSIGEKSYKSYKMFFDAGAERYLLRQESANKEHYRKLHPRAQSLENRLRCLDDLKEVGYQVGCGFMVDSPFQSLKDIYCDLMFMKKFGPDMVGIGPFIPHHATPFCNKPQGALADTLNILSITRLLLPDVLLPSTTALGTVSKNGREKGILAGANVVMPNLSPISVRDKYLLYDNKICTGSESAECLSCLKSRIESIGYKIVESRGDRKKT